MRARGTHKKIDERIVVLRWEKEKKRKGGPRTKPAEDFVNRQIRKYREGEQSRRRRVVHVRVEALRADHSRALAGVEFERIWRQNWKRKAPPPT